MGKGIDDGRTPLAAAPDQPFIPERLTQVALDAPEHLDDNELEAQWRLGHELAGELKDFARAVARAEHRQRSRAQALYQQMQTRQWRRRAELEVTTARGQGPIGTLAQIVSREVDLPDEMPFSDIVLFTRSGRIVRLHELALAPPKTAQSPGWWRVGGPAEKPRSVGQLRKMFNGGYLFVIGGTSPTDFRVSSTHLRAPIYRAQVEAIVTNQGIRRQLELTDIRIRLDQVASAVVRHRDGKCGHLPDDLR